MTIQKFKNSYIAECDSCDVTINLKSPTPVSATRELFSVGWKRVDFIRNIRYPAFLWSCLKCKDKER